MCLGRWQVLIYMFRVLREDVWFTTIISFILRQPAVLVVRISIMLSLDQLLIRGLMALDQKLLRGMYSPIR